MPLCVAFRYTNKVHFYTRLCVWDCFKHRGHTMNRHLMFENTVKREDTSLHVWRNEIK
jgi:hypothetical protein